MPLRLDGIVAQARPQPLAQLADMTFDDTLVDFLVS